jgi:hypothetical protein
MRVFMRVTTRLFAREAASDEVIRGEKQADSIGVESTLGRICRNSSSTRAF